MANILITGANGGFGLLTVAALVDAGHRVVASVRDPEGRNRAAAADLLSIGAQVVAIDVTDDQQVSRGVREALSMMGTLDVLINNAGVGAHGLLETFTAEDIERIFNVNVLGVHRMQRAVLPYMRAQRHGLILNVSSLLGRVTIPFYGPYNASKWALEALTENTRVENSQAGIEVALIEPGAFATAFIEHLAKPSDDARIESLGALAEMPAQRLKAFEQVLANNPEQNPRKVAEAIVDVISAPRGQRPFRTTVDFMGMGQGVEALNKVHSDVTLGTYKAFGTEALLRLPASAIES